MYKFQFTAILSCLLFNPPSKYVYSLAIECTYIITLRWSYKLFILGADYNFFSSHATEFHQNIIKASGSMERHSQLNHF